MDTLAQAKKLETLGFDRPKAEGLVQMVKQSIDEEVAKKTDLRELRADLKSDISEVRLEIGQVKSELKQDIADLRMELKQDIADMKIDIGAMKGEIGEMKGVIGDMKGDIKALDAKIDLSLEQQTKKLGKLIIVLFALGLDWGKGFHYLNLLFQKIQNLIS